MRLQRNEATTLELYSLPLCMWLCQRSVLQARKSYGAKALLSEQGVT